MNKWLLLVLLNVAFSAHSEGGVWNFITIPWGSIAGNAADKAARKIEWYRKVSDFLVVYKQTLGDLMETVGAAGFSHYRSYQKSHKDCEWYQSLYAYSVANISTQLQSRGSYLKSVVAPPPVVLVDTTIILYLSSKGVRFAGEIYSYAGWLKKKLLFWKRRHNPMLNKRTVIVFEKTEKND
jgi:hypothetical protein